MRIKNLKIFSDLIDFFRTPQIVDMTTPEQKEANARMAYLRHSSDRLMKDLTKEEEDAVMHYSTMGYSSLNSKLRLGETPKGVELLDSALRKYHYDPSLYGNLKVYRKIYLIGNAKTKFISDIREKGYYIDKGYQSTSIDPKACTFQYNIELVLEIENPYAGAYIETIAFRHGEKEYLIGRNTRVDVDSIEEVDEGEKGLITVMKGRVTK